MTLRKPIIQIIGPSGRNIVPVLGPAFLGATVTDQEGYESDALTIRATARPPFLTLPAKGSRYTVIAGWSASSLTTLGIFEYQSASVRGSPEDGDEIELTCRAADFLDKDKSAGRGHYDETTGHGTAGKIIDSLASEMGVSAVVASALRDIKIPYRLRWNQSAIDFLSDLADEIGATVKPQAGKLVVRERGAAASASGRALPAISVNRMQAYSYEFQIEPRSGFRTVETPYFDAAKGFVKTVEAATGKAASLFNAMHPFASEDEARRGGKAMAQQLSRNTGSGTIEIAGNAAATGGAPIDVSGFGSDVDAIEWEADSVQHDFTPEPGWITTINLAAKEKA